jgi:pimeloyl-ACP methyl ester carboxylesterase
MVKAMEESGKLFCITFNNRAGRVTRRIKELVDTGAVGNVRMVRLIGLMAAPDNRLVRERFGEDLARKRAVGICCEGKNALFDCGVHSFDFARFLTGSEFKRIEAMGYAMRGFPYPDHGVALCEHENGIFTVIEKGFDYAFEAQRYKEYVRYEVIGDGGSLAWDLDTHLLKLFARDRTLEEKVVHESKEEVRRAIYRGFIEGIQSGKMPWWLATGLDGLRAIEAAQMATDSMIAKGVIRRDVGDTRNWFDLKPQNPPFPGKKTDYRGYDRYDFTVDQTPVLVVVPKQVAPGRPWIWRAEFFDHRPETDLALLAKGFHLVYMNVGNTFGCPSAMAHWDVLYKYLTEEHGFAKKMALEGLSRGGLYCYNWASANPDKVACIYGDAPVCDIKSWPAGKGKGTGNPAEWAKLIKEYGFKSEEEALAYDKNPIDNLKPLADAKIPLIHVCGDADTGVPYAENTVVLKERYEKLGGHIEVIVKKGCGHHPHGLDDPTPIVQFILKHTPGKE